MDNYLGFTFKDVNSTDHNAFIANEGSDLKFFNAPSFSDIFVTPTLGNRSYYTGTTKDNKTISFRIIVQNVTLENYKKFLNWLNIDDVGYLSFDYNKDWGYNVKVASLSEGEFTITDPVNSKYTIDLEVSFVTVNDWAAHYIKEENLTWSLLPLGTVPDLGYATYISGTEGTEGNVTFKLKNDFNLPMYFVIEWKDISSILIKDNNNIIYEGTYSSIADKEGCIYTQYGLALNKETSFINLSTNMGVWFVDSNSTKDNMSITWTESGAAPELKITPIVRDIL